jgi:protoheme IX farnesyltransferase
MLVTAGIGMLLASPSLLAPQLWPKMIVALLGIALCGGSAAVINHLIDRQVDALMIRTQTRPIACGRISPREAFVFSVLLSSLGLILLFFWVNALTALLSSITIFGYAVLYTLFLKRATPQNIVIGGIAGAMPPLLGWAAISNSIEPQALLLVLIIFVWTPPHFWALAIYRAADYQAAKIPMLPVTHGIAYTTFFMLLYTVLLFIISLLPFLIGMSGYLFSALVLGSLFLIKVFRLHRSPKEQLSKRSINTFNFSILYLLLLFGSLLIDRMVNPT